MKVATLCALAVSGAAAMMPTRRGASPVQARDDSSPKPSYAAHTIDQPIDHFPDSFRYKPHTNATFKQRYFFEDKYYKPGGPVFLYIGGETSGENRFSNLDTGSQCTTELNQHPQIITYKGGANKWSAVIQILMEATNGLGVILENRYYGKSYPFESSSTDELRFLTTEQTIADNAYFAQHAQFPGVNASLNAPGTPWILYGGSLAGAQTAYSLKVYGGDDGILWGGIASSGTTQSDWVYPQWYDPIQKYGPQDCVGTINGLVDNIDMVFASGNETAIHHMKSLFGLEALKDNRDFAMTIAFPLGGPMNYPLPTWQELNWHPEYNSNDFWLFCKNITNFDAPEEITQVDYELSSFTHGESWPGLGKYANFIKKYLIPYCEGAPIDSPECFGTQHPEYYANTTNTGGRSYLYSTCIAAGIYQVAPLTGPSLLSRTVQADYTQQWCTWSFPPGEHNMIPPRPNIEENNKYGGFNVIADRLAHIDGDQDVWKDVCYHSDRAGPRRTPNAREAELHPQYLITGAGHHWDSYGIKDVEAEPQFIREAHLWEIRTVKRWVAEFNEKKNKNYS